MRWLSVVSAGAPPEALCPKGAVETRGDNPEVSPWVSGTVAGAGDVRRVNGQTPCAAGAVHGQKLVPLKLTFPSALLSCPSQFALLLLIGATLIPWSRGHSQLCSLLPEPPSHTFPPGGQISGTAL